MLAYTRIDVLNNSVQLNISVAIMQNHIYHPAVSDSAYENATVIKRPSDYRVHLVKILP